VRVIVTGGAESVGLHAVCAHVNAGNAVLVLDNPFAGQKGNLNSPAEQVNIRRSVVDPLFDSEVNAIGTISPLCEAVGAEAMFGFAGRVSLEEGL